MERLKAIENYEVVRDYATFIKKMIYYMDNTNKPDTIIDDNKFNRIKDLLERDENLGPDEIAVISDLFWEGIGF